jgi:hypothetical protein
LAGTITIAIRMAANINISANTGIRSRSTKG